MTCIISKCLRGRRVDDNAHIMLRFYKGAKGMMWASMVAAGRLHGQRIQVYGEKGTIAEAAVESLHMNRPVKITYWQPE